MQLQELFDYKNKLMEILLTNEKIIELLDEEISLDDAPRLAYTQVFPYEYIPETVNEGQTFICFDVDVSDVVNKTFLKPTLYIWVFTHRSKLRLPNGAGVRTDRLTSRICELINGSFEFGAGALELASVRRFAPMTDFQGKQLTFRAVEINRFYDPHKTLPTNRRV